MGLTPEQFAAYHLVRPILHPLIDAGAKYRDALFEHEEAPTPESAEAVAAAGRALLRAAETLPPPSRSRT